MQPARYRHRRALTALACSLLASCATPTDPAADTIYGTPGRIVAMEATPPGSVAYPEGTPPAMIYTLRTRVGEELRTTSRRRFNSGDCVILWHGLRTFVQPGNPFNYLGGNLEPYDNCTEPPQP